MTSPGGNRGVRPARLDDCEPCNQLLRRVGLAVPRGAAAAREQWRRLWCDNPAVGDAPASPGWVMEHAGRIVGFFANIPVDYAFGGVRVRVAVASHWGIEKPYRGRILALADAYFGQAGADVLMATTAIRPVARVFERYGAAPMPQPDYDRVPFWIVGARGFAAAAARRKGLGRRLAALAAGLGGPVLGAAAAAMRLGLPRGAAVERLALAGVGAEFDELWRRKRAETDRLMAWRDARTLQWHFRHRAGEVVFLTCRVGGRLEGYAAVQPDDSAGLGLSRLAFVDMVVAGDDGRVADNLIAGALALARERDCHVVEALGLPPALRRRVSAFRPWHRRLPTLPFLYRAADADLAARLAAPAAWHATAYDGDTSLV